MNALNDNLNERNLLRFITAGSVDDGKSTDWPPAVRQQGHLRRPARSRIARQA